MEAIETYIYGFERNWIYIYICCSYGYIYIHIIFGFAQQMAMEKMMVNYDQSPGQ
jgi:hypothetical protein